MKLVLYSALYGTKEPLNPDVFGPFSTARKVLFTDREDLTLPGVEIIHDPLDGLDPARASRRAKLRPHLYFPNEDWSIWLDNKSSLRTDPARLIEGLQARPDVAFFAFPHFVRDCVYQEGRVVCEMGLDDYRIIRERMRTYRAEGMPEHAGLIEGHFIVRRHNDPTLAAFGEEWFDHVCRFSRRDQISFPYLAWKRALKFDYLPRADWPATVEFDRVPRKGRKPDFPRKHLAWQVARTLWHQLRARLK